MDTSYETFPDLDKILECLRAKYGGRCKSLRGLENQFNELYNLLSRTVQRGISDSIIISGPPSSGKSSLVKACLDRLESDEDPDSYCLVNLDGIIHTDDNRALKKIISTLKTEELEDRKVGGNFSDNLMFVLHCFKSGNKNVSKPIIFILEHLELFCHHRNQTLLYNLFDVVQSAQAPISVVGVTSRIDLTELLEKRVKSRFSHREITLFPDLDFENRMKLVSDYLTLPGKSNFKLSKDVTKAWNMQLDKFLKNGKVRDIFQRQLQLKPKETELKALMFEMLFAFELYDSFTAGDLEKLTKCTTDSKIQILLDLSVTELCLVIAMSQLMQIYDGEPFNFKMVLNHYLKFANQNRSTQTLESVLLFKAYERLKGLELILPCGRDDANNPMPDLQLHTLLATDSQVRDAVNSYIGLPTEVSQWAFSPIP